VAEAPTQGHRRVWDVTEAEKVDVSAVASSGNLVMLAAMRRASLWVSSLASGGFLPTSRLIVLSITGHLVICRTDRHILVD
jgi:hypothetical protein